VEDEPELAVAGKIRVKWPQWLAGGQLPDRVGACEAGHDGVHSTIVRPLYGRAEQVDLD
jgi:hypothetical protein